MWFVVYIVCIKSQEVTKQLQHAVVFMKWTERDFYVYEVCPCSLKSCSFNLQGRI